MSPHRIEVIPSQQNLIQRWQKQLIAGLCVLFSFKGVQTQAEQNRIVSSIDRKFLEWFPPFPDTIPLQVNPLAHKVKYDIIPFMVPSDGNYVITSSTITTGAWPHLLFIYESTFDPTSPGQFGLIGQTSDSQTQTASIQYALAQGTRYYAIVCNIESEFEPGQKQLFTLQIDPAGNGASRWTRDPLGFHAIPEMPGQTEMQVTGISGNGKQIIGTATSLLSTRPTKYAVRYNLDGRSLQILAAPENAISVTEDGGAVLMERGGVWSDDFGHHDIPDDSQSGMTVTRISQRGSRAYGGTKLQNFPAICDLDLTSSSFEWQRIYKNTPPFSFQGEVIGGAEFGTEYFVINAVREVDQVVQLTEYESGYMIPIQHWDAVGSRPSQGSLVGTAISQNGDFIVGYREVQNGAEGFIYNAHNGSRVRYASGLEDLEGGTIDARATGVSADGSIVVGYGTSSNGREALIWDVGARRSLWDREATTVKDSLEAAGIEMEDWLLTEATGISDDGSVVVGNGIYRGNKKCWIAFLEYPPLISNNPDNIGFKVGVMQSVNAFSGGVSRKPSSFGASNLPSGLTMESSTGNIIGTPTERGVYPIEIYAANTAGISKRVASKIVIGEPKISGPSVFVAYTDVIVDIDLGADNEGEFHQNIFLPPGLSISKSGNIRGIPMQPGTYESIIRASNAAGVSEFRVKFFVHPPAIGFWSDTSVISERGEPFAYRVLTVEQAIIAYRANGLPAGLVLNPATGVLTGVPESIGRFPVTFSAMRVDGIVAEYIAEFFVVEPDNEFDPALLYESYGTGLRISHVAEADEIERRPRWDNPVFGGSITIDNASDRWSLPGRVEVKRVGQEVASGPGGLAYNCAGDEQPIFHFDAIPPYSSRVVSLDEVNNELGTHYVLACTGEPANAEKSYALVATVYEHIPDSSHPEGLRSMVQDSQVLAAFENYATFPPSGAVTLTRYDLTLAKRPEINLISASIEPVNRNEVKEGNILSLNWRAVYSDGYKYSTGRNGIKLDPQLPGFSITDGNLVAGQVSEDTLVKVKVTLSYNRLEKTGEKWIKIINNSPPSSIATVSTTAASGVTHSAATAGGNVTNNGGVNVTERGLVYGPSENPTMASGTKVVSGGGVGVFSTNLSGLTANTTYYVRAYAINEIGTAYGSQISFTTKPPPPVHDPFEISTVSMPTSGPVRIGFRAQAGVVYTLQRSIDLMLWDAVSTLTPMTSGIVTIEDNSTRTQSRYFYRISEGN